MYRAKPINVVLHLLLTVALLLVVVSLVVAQSNRAGTARRRTVISRVASGRRAPHLPIGKMSRLPASITAKTFSARLTRLACGWHPKGTSRVAGDANVPRQTTLLTKRVPAAGFTVDFARSMDLHPNWSDIANIYFDSDRVSATDTTQRPDGIFNIYKMTTDGSSVTPVTSLSDGISKIEPNISSFSNRMAYVAGGTVTLPGPLNPAFHGSAQITTTGFKLFVMDLGSGTTTPLTGTEFDDVRHPSFSPGGADLAFAGKRRGDSVYHIFTINVAQGSSTLQQYTAGTANEYSPAWSPASGNASLSVIAFTTNASGYAGITAPVTSSGTFVHDEIYVLQPLATRPFPKRVTRFYAGTPLANESNFASNRNPAWATATQDTAQVGVPPNPIDPTEGRFMLAFGSTRADTDVTQPGVPNALSPNFSTDVYFVDAPIGADPQSNQTTVVRSEIPFDVNGVYTGAHKLQTSNPQAQIDSVDPQPFDPNFQTNEDNPTFPQFFTTYQIAYQSDRASNFNIWSSAILDLNAPTLLKYDENTNEIVRVERLDGSQPVNRQYDAGSTIRFKVRAVDYQSGVKAVFLQIKCPDSSLKSADGQEHKIFYIGPGQLDTTTFVINPPYEFDSQALKATDTSAGAIFRRPGPTNAPAFLGFLGGFPPANFPGFNAYTPNIQDFEAYSGYNSGINGLFADTPENANAIPDRDGGYWLRLNQSTDPNQADMYTVDWQTPVNFPSDMIIDVVVYDNAVYPFDPSGGTRYNWKIYDNVWGFTTRPFNTLPTSHTLYVNDYDTGQKFLNSRFGTGNFEQIQNWGGMGFEGTPTESWMTEFDKQLFPNTYITGTTAGPLVHFETPLGQNSYTDDLTGLGSNGGPLTGDYDVWRIQCRGPIPDSVLNQYGPRAVQQPVDILGGAADARPSIVADKCVIWHAPYLGDLFVGPGTLLDQDTQGRLAAFVGRGGRLFVNGQDVAFGLSLGQSETITPGTPPPTVINPFLNNTLHAVYLADQALGPTAANDILNGPSAGKAPGLNPIAFETWYDRNHPDFVDPTAAENPPLSAPPIFLGYTKFNPTDHDYGCQNQGNTELFDLTRQLLIVSDTPIGSPDRVQFDYSSFPQPPAGAANVTVGQLYPGVYGIDSYYNPNGANSSAAIMWYKNTVAGAGNVVGGKVVFSPVGWECINPDFFTVPGSNPPIIELRNRRVELMHNVLDYLRTGRIRGTIRSRNPSGSVTTVVPNAFVRVTRVDRVTGRLTTYGTARTLSDGTYIIEGLDALGFYNIDATSSGFNTQHATSSVFHGGYEAVNDLYITQAVPAIVTGRITSSVRDAQGNFLPVSGAIVQARDITADQAITNSTDPVFSSLPSDANGVYTIRNVPSGAEYQLTVTNAAALGFNPVPIPPFRIIPTQATPPTTPPTISLLPSAATVSGQDFQLTLPPGTVSGHVFGVDPLNLDPAKRGPVPIVGATVTANPGAVTTVTTTGGVYSLSLGAGTYGLTASAPGYGTNAVPVPATVISNQNTPNIDITLTALPPGSLSGLVTTSPPNSLPVSGATITVTDSNGNVLATTTSGPNTTSPNQAAGVYTFGNIPSGATVQVTAAKTGYTPKPNPDTQTATITSGVETKNVNFILDPLFTFNSDLTLVSSPFTFGSQSIAQLFGIPSGDVGTTFSFVGWDAPNQKYLYYPQSETNFQLGQGYFLQETDPAVTLALITQGTPAPQDTTGNYQDFSVQLVNGWNLIGDPFTAPVDFARMRVVDPSNTANPTIDVPTAQSGSSPLIGAALYTYEHGTYEIVYTIDPFRGYWLRAFKPLTLIFSAGAQQSRAGIAALKQTHRAIDVQNVTGEGWKLQLKAQVDDGSIKVGSNAYLGTSRAATDAYDKFKMQVPPSVTKQGVQIGFTHKDWGDKSADYMMDIRSSAAKSWEFTVTSNVPNAPVTLTWPGMASLPRRMEAQLTDLDTQQVISMRNRSSMVIPAGGNALLKRYRLDMAQVSHAHDLQITGLVVSAVNGGRAIAGTPAPVGISYNLSAPATVKVNIMQGTRRIRTIQPGVTRAAGINQLTWDGKTDQGSVVAANAYTVEVTAIDPNTGHMARQIQQVLVTR